MTTPMPSSTSTPISWPSFESTPAPLVKERVLAHGDQIA